jgi:ribonuclease HII
MRAALEDLKSRLPEGRPFFLLVDGSLPLPGFRGLQEAVVGGDNRVRSIAAASIAAKVTRDRLFDGYEEAYPGYGFAKHKGYGTREHFEALRRLGPCPLHRTSFKPVKLSIPENANRAFAGELRARRAF